MKPESSESGFDELMRLSRQFTRQKQEHTARERQREEQSKKVRGVLQGLKELKVSMAMEQLKHVATPEVIKSVRQLKDKQGTEELRKMISDLAYELEKRIDDISVSTPAVTPLTKSVKILNILMDLYFSLH